MMEKTGAERLAIGCQMTDTARKLVWSGIPKELPEEQRRKIFIERFYGEDGKGKKEAKGVSISDKTKEEVIQAMEAN